MPYQIDDYCYLYETHLHTNLASGCASDTGTEMAAAAKKERSSERSIGVQGKRIDWQARLTFQK